MDMERLLAPTTVPDSSILDEHLAAMECLQHELLTSGNLRFTQEQEQGNVLFSETTIEENNIPFLQMLQCVEPNILQSFLQIQTTLDPESCLTHASMTAIDVNRHHDHDHDHLVNFGSISSSRPPSPAQASRDPETDLRPGNGSPARDRRKRKRTTRAPKNKEEVENQRMNHITVERNRRRQMNEHLNTLRSLMPPSYLQRGDQASVVGGAIDFIKELEQLVHSLDSAGKRTKTGEEEKDHDDKPAKTVCNSSLSSALTSVDGGSLTGRSAAAEIEATMIQDQVNLKVRCKRGRGQIVKAIVSLEKLKFTILHLNITSSLDLVFYSFNLKVEDDCKLGSADEIVLAAHQMFEQINGG